MSGKKQAKSKRITGSKTTMSGVVKDYGNESFFVQKAEASKKIMEKYTLPKELITKKK